MTSHKSQTASRVEEVEDREILPASVKPVHYDLSLTPDLEKLEFEGQVAIDLEVKEATDKIVLNSNELTIKQVVVESSSEGQQTKTQEVAKGKYDVDPEMERLTIQLDEKLQVGSKTVLKLKFSGVLNDLMVGFYRSKYTDGQGNEKNMATTQFEPTDARRAFPCWDEPALKATFTVTLHVPKGLTALSNMEVESDQEGSNGLREVRFEKTPIMSTYLLAFVVGELEYIEAYTSGKFNEKPIRCRIYTPPGQSERGQFALDVTVKVLEYFAEIFGIAYPLPKMDQVAVPDFEAGAMENWGLVTYRTIALLVDEKNSGSRAKQQVAATVSHELAHQWFGNLVTMEWWSELWLNEGFATWVGNLAVDYVFPEWQTWTQFLVDDYSRALTMDSMRSSHAIQVPVKRPADISQIFDIISYSKGASTIRMLSAYLGLDTFLQGIRLYLSRHKYDNASTDDLWAALSETSGRDVAKFMKLWTKTVGYPLLTVSASENSTTNNNSITVTQSRFLSSGHATPEEDTTVWWVPLLMSTGVDGSSGGQIADAVLSTRSAEIPLPANFTNEWYKLNTGTVSLVRVKYPDAAISRLSAAIEQGKLALNDRIGLVADAGALAYSGHSKTSHFLTLLLSFKDEDNLVVWQEIAIRLEALMSAWNEEPDSTIDKLKNLQRSLFAGLVARVGWEPTPGEDSLTSRLRSLAIRAAGMAGDQAIIDEAKRRFNRFLVDDDSSALHSDLRAPVFALAIYYGGLDQYNLVKNYYLNTSLPMDQRIIALNSLGSTNNPDIAKLTLDFVLSDHVRSQDLYNGLLYLSTHKNTRSLLWNWYTSNYEMLLDRYRASMASLGIMVKICAGEFSSTAQADLVSAFFDDKDTSKFSRALDQTLERIRAKAAWVSRDRSDVDSWLASHNY
ncbi:Aminopeptidase 1 [Zancudomyces culisetae]|uniref:Aminopeptidase n=1 Tax=Zancudomyces culisetae TaxID=1213189 RepID=A0A1R1PUB5_ZANCU|nr:Aminopeptidase 1 [Zancudomyces culisetae]|eukprot:OMH84586.1 Aminopeptidase 1 [Zancudomyces culisetae]